MKLLASDYTDEDLIARWEEFFETSDYRVKIMEVAGNYPEQRSVFVEYANLDLFDPDMAEFVLQYPVRALAMARPAVRKLLPPGRERAEVQLRLTHLPRDSKVEIRKIRSEHLGRLIAVEGLVRKATEVRPKIVDALFQCARCGMVIKEQQEGMYFKEPMECYKEQNGCGRTSSSTKFKLLSEDSRYVDTQKVEIQENPEGLRGGAQPERLTGFIEEDLAGSVSPGDRLVLNGILRSVQKGAVQKSTLFDINLDVLSIELKTQEYEEVSLSEEDEVEILRQAKDPALFRKIVSSISPTIYGYDREKEAIALQLFGGVHKSLDDGTKIRGDIHVLLVGDPGVAKCVTGDAEVWLADQSSRPIRDIVEEAVAKGPVEKVDDGVWAPLDLMVLTFSNRGAIDFGKAVRAWKRTSPPKMLRIVTKGGRKLTVTPTHPLFVQNGPWIQFRPAHLIFINQNIAIATQTGLTGYDETHGFQRGLDWDQVVSKEEVPAQEEFVYDLEVEGTHNFITNGIISHNSQILRYMSDLAPRGIYASGKSSSAAGLCVHPDTTIWVDGKATRIGRFVEGRISDPVEVRPGMWKQETDGCTVDSVWSGKDQARELRAVWRIATPSKLVQLVAEGGESIVLTPETRVNAKRFGMAGGFSRCQDLNPGDEVLLRRDGRLAWDRLEERKEIAGELPEHVYDLTVEESHTFVANGFVVHNTAAAVKDDFGEGRWTLEAGALVLADQGMACVDGEQFVILGDGITRLKRMRPGSAIVNGAGWRDYNQVRHVMDKGLRECVRVRLYSGDDIVCTPDHKILTSDGWKEASSLTGQDHVKIPILECPQGTSVHQERMECGFLNGFMLCDWVIPKDDHCMHTSFSASSKNKVRTDYVLELLRRHHGTEFKVRNRGPQHGVIYGKHVDFGEVVQCCGWSRSVCADAKYSLEAERGGYFDFSYVIGFLAGIISTDCCVSHKQGTYGVKHTIEIGLGRSKYDDEWLERKQVLVTSLLHSLGIMAVRRGRKVLVTSLRSYNLLVDLIGPFVIGRNKQKLYKVEAKTRIQSDDDLMDEEYHRWFGSVKFNTSRTVSLGLHSRIWYARRKGRVTETLMRTLEGYWPQITGEPFKDPEKSYLLNRVIGVEDAGYRHVYDMQVEGDHSFLVNGGLVHNCIDELDKMTDQDRSSMHEAMESQSVSVAKAGITARLQCRCSILGAANPKYGRFEESQFIADQIDLPPALMSRFDLIFAMTDKPDSDKDARITRHILNVHRRGEILKNEDLSDIPGMDIDAMLQDTSALEPTYSKEFLRKYVAYSKRITPILTDEAVKLITENYLSIRRMGEGENKSVPITARQLEAYVRLAEASARARLSRVVTIDDARRSVGIVEYYLRKIAGEAGRLDIDIIATGTSRSQREQIVTLRAIIQENADREKGIPIDQLIQLSEAENIPEERVRMLVKRLHDNGEVYSPTSGYYKLSSEGRE